MPKRECNLRTELGSDCSWQRHYTSLGLDKAQSLQLRAAIYTEPAEIQLMLPLKKLGNPSRKGTVKSWKHNFILLGVQSFPFTPLGLTCPQKGTSNFRCLDEARPPTDMLPHREPPPIHIQFLINGWLLPPWKISQEPGTLPKAQGENLWNHWNRTGSWEHSESTTNSKFCLSNQVALADSLFPGLSQKPHKPCGPKLTVDQVSKYPN